VPSTSLELLLAFFSPGDPALLLVTPVTTDEKIVPLSVANLLLLDFSRISWQIYHWRS